MTFLVERLAELRRHLDHLRELRPRIEALDELEPIEPFAAIVADVEAEG